MRTDELTREVLAGLDAHRPGRPATATSRPARSRRAARASGGLGVAMLVAVFGILAVLVLEFGSFRSMLIVFGVVPLGIIGGLVALFLTGYTLSFTAMIGFIALIGIEIKNSILLVDFTNQLRAQGMALDDAIARGGRSALPADPADLAHRDRRPDAARARRARGSTRRSRS